MTITEVSDSLIETWTCLPAIAGDEKTFSDISIQLCEQS